MAHIFKHPNRNNKGILVITHQEIDFILRTPQIHEKVKHILQDYYLGVHYGGFSFGAYLPPFCSFYMGRPSVTDIKVRQPDVFDIPLASGNFTSRVFNENKDAYNYWDIINVSRNGNVKKLKTFFREVKKIYELGHKYNILLVCASREEETEQDHFIDIADVYYDMFTKEEQEMFTLMRLGKDLEFKGLSKKQLSFFYQSSKVMTLFSEMEGFPGVIPEALLTGTTVVIWKHQKGSGHDYLNETNAKLFESYEDAHKTLIDAVETYDATNFDFSSLQQDLNEDKSLEKLKEYFVDMYKRHGQTFDGELINTDNLVSRLPAHYVDLEWVKGREGHGHVKTAEQFDMFYRSLYNDKS